MKIALITPPFDLMKQGYGSKRSIRAGFFPPLGIGYLAAPLLKKGHEIKIIDCPPLSYQNEDVVAALEIFKPDIIGVSSLTAAAEQAYSLINSLKDKWPSIPIILGGAHATCFPDLCFKNSPELNCLVYGEGEKIFEEIVNSIERTGRISSDIKSAWIRTESWGIVKNMAAEPVLNLDELLSPTWELYDWKIYRPLPLQYKNLPVANIVTSRGCPWGRCTFCFESGRASQKYRRYSPQKAVAEIKNLVDNFGIKEVAFWDDNFMVNDKWVFEFCDLLECEGVRIPWSANARVNSITKSMLERAKKAGLWNLFFGFETGNADLLIRIKKGATVEQARQAAKWTNELDIDTRGSFILALPGETPEKAMNTINFAKELNITYAQFLPAFPEWGTELYDDAIQSGRIVPMYRGRTGVTYVPDGYKNEEEVRAIQKKAYHDFYFRPSYIWKHVKRLNSLGKIKQYYEAFKYIIGVSS